VYVIFSLLHFSMVDTRNCIAPSVPLISHNCVTEEAVNSFPHVAYFRLERKEEMGSYC
jgi:hypothetical protein